MSSKSESSLVYMSSTWESLLTILDDFLSDFLEHLQAPVTISSQETLKTRDAERYLISQGVDESVQAVWIESELAGNAGEIFHAMCETPKMIGDDTSDHEANTVEAEFDAIWLKIGDNPFTDIGDNERVITVTVIGKGPRWIRTDTVVGEAVNFLESPEATPEYEWELDEDAIVFETIGFVPVSATAAVNFLSPHSFMSALQSQVRMTRKALPIEVARDFSNIEQDNEMERIARYSRNR